MGAGSPGFRFGSYFLASLQKTEEPSNVAFILHQAILPTLFSLLICRSGSISVNKLLSVGLEDVSLDWIKMKAYFEKEGID